jgi:very-short-patch-repair endonuclease
MSVHIVKSRQYKCSQPTEYAKQLHAALVKVGVEAHLEHPDGHKCVDIYVPKAKLYIEVDGKHHYISARQIQTDFDRDHYSDDDGFHTLHIANEVVEKQGIKIARAIQKIVSSY